MVRANSGLEVVISTTTEPFFDPFQHAVGAQDNLFDILRIAHDGENHLGGLGHSFGRRAPVGATFDEIGGFAAGSVEQVNLMAGIDKVATHGVAHDTGSDPADGDLFHGRFSLMVGVDLR